MHAASRYILFSIIHDIDYVILCCWRCPLGLLARIYYCSFTHAYKYALIWNGRQQLEEAEVDMSILVFMASVGSSFLICSFSMLLLFRERFVVVELQVCTGQPHGQTDGLCRTSRRRSGTSAAIRGRRTCVAQSSSDNTTTTCDRPLRRCVNLSQRRLLRISALTDALHRLAGTHCRKLSLIVTPLLCLSLG